MSGGSLPDLILDELNKRGWSLRELSRRIDEHVDALDASGVKGNGLSLSALSKLTDSSASVEPDLRSLRLLSMAFGRPLRVFLIALGYDPDASEALGEPRKRTLAAVEGAPDATAALLDRVIALRPEQKDALAAFLSYLEQGGK